jgi:hypothetical protein
MSSATSTEDSPQSARGEDQGLHPWQFFLLAGMLSATAVVLLVAGQSPASIIVLSLTVVAASFVALGTYRSFAPLVVPGGAQAPPLIVGRTRAALEREKTLVLRSIKELEFDFAMKKIAQADFDDLSARLRTRAIGLMKQLDEAGGYRADIEREIAARLGSAKTAPPSTSPEGQGFSPGNHMQCACGTANDPDARFCKNCGSKLVAA